MHAGFRSGERQLRAAADGSFSPLKMQVLRGKATEGFRGISYRKFDKQAVNLSGNAITGWRR
jgi:hypothetical protein